MAGTVDTEPNLNLNHKQTLAQNDKIAKNLPVASNKMDLKVDQALSDPADVGAF